MSTPLTIKAKAAILHKIVFEVRYRYGYTYLDKCGKTINLIMRDAPEWIVRADQPNPQLASMVSMRNGCEFHFSALKYGFGIEQPVGANPISDDDLKQFVEQVDLLCRIVHDQLGLKEFTRIGFRVWYLFACQDKAESESWLRGLNCFSIPDRISTAFEAEIEAATLAVVMKGQDRKYRVAFSGVERHAQVDLGQSILSVRASSLHENQDKFLREQLKTKKRLLQNPEFAAMIDIDAYQEDPPSTDPADFIQKSVTEGRARLLAALRT